TLAGGIARTLIYTATVDRGAVGGTRLTNQAELVGSTLDNAVNDPSVERVLTTAASDTVTVVGATIAKTVAPAARTIGQTATFTATVTIPAKVTFYNLAVIDRLPAGFDRTTLTTDTVECVNADASTCDLNAEELVPEAQLDGSTLLGWNLGNATAATQARTVRITYSVAVKDLAGVTRGNALSNAAYAKWDSVAGPAPTSPSYSFTQGTPQPAVATVIVEEPLLAVDKTVSDTTPEPGQQFTYTIKVTNSNAANVSTAYNTLVTDTVPVGVVVKTPLPAGAILTGAGVNGGGTITWTVSGTILTGANKTLSYNAVLAPSASLTTAALTNTADITGYRSLPGSGRLYDGPSDPATVRPAFPVLTVTKTTPAGPVAYLGEDFLWRIEVKNTGGGRALSVDVSDALPPNWQYVIGTASVTVGSSATVATEPAIGIAGAVQTLSFNDIGDLGVGDTAVILLRARPLPAAATTPGVGASIKHTNTVVATATDATGAPGNAVGPYRGSGSADARIDSADVVMTKTHATPVIAGAGLSWRLTVSNSGPDQAVGPFTVADTVPTGAELVSATGTGWSCDINGRQVSCTRINGADTLNSGSSFPVITVVQRVPADTASGTTFANEATVDARTFDPNVPNNTDPDTAVVTTAADLAITKRLVGPMVAGREATYTLDVINRGPSVAQGTITVADAVPAGATFVSASGSGWNCALASGTITCQRAANLGVQVSAPQITVIVDVDQGRTSAVTNTATVSGPTTDPDPSNNSSTVEKVPDTSADLVMQKSSTAPVVAGSTGVYRLRVRNLGPSAAQAVTVVDPLPTGLTYQSFSSVTGSWSCSASGQSVTCSLSGAQDAGTTTEVDITVQASSGLSGDVTNTATVNSTTPDPDPSSNTDSDTSPPVTSADLSITKSHTAAAIAGSNLAFTLTVSNNGPSDSQGPITVTDVLPAQMSFVSASGTGWSCSHSSGTITCTRAATLVASADAPAITVVALIDPDAGPAQLANTAVVDPGPTEDPDLFNNTSTDEVEVRDSANVVLAKTVTGANPVTAGSSTLFAITVTNEGPSTADDVVVVDSLPAGFESASVSGSGWSCEPVVDLQISCRRDALAPGVAPALTVVAKVSPGTNDAAVLTNTASVTTATPGDDPADNEDSASVTVRTRADLVLTKTADAPRTEAGGSASFTIAVTNDGPSDTAGDIVVTDSLPPGLRYSDVTGPWDCVPGAVSPSGQQVVCTLANNAGIPAGGAAPDLTLLVEVDGATDPGDYTNTAEADSPTVDPDPSNNSDDADITVERVVDLSITKTHDPEPVIGQPVTFTMVVTNKGPSQARSVVSSDVLPAGLEPVSADGADDGWTCAVDGQRVSCALENPLEAGSSATYTVTATVLPSAYPQVTNTATTSSDIDDEDPSDNSAADRLIVPPLVDLSITKSHSGSFTVGSTGTYTLTVRNSGPTNDPGPITVTDDLPAGLSFVSASGTGWSCSRVGSTVTCIRAQGLAVDASSRISLKVAVGTAAEPGVTNTAVVSTPSAETDTQNNADDDPTEVLAAARLSVIKDLVGVKGREATYRITVTNKGPSTTTTPIVVTDSLPAGLSYVSASGEAWACAHRAPVVTCTYIDPMIKGLSASFTVVTTVAQSATGQIRNIAVATGGSPSSGTSTGSADLLLPTGSGTAKTGAAVAALLLAALAMLAAGAGLVRASRRKPNP
ncbi:MAG TPA: hypothetical protein DHW34_02590, partial [Actinobacteria bacterium]|nr:hypothetical protein [Actinomycetota bacterium]